MNAARIAKRRSLGIWQCALPLVALSAIYAVGDAVLAARSFGVQDASGVLWTTIFRLVLAWWVLADRCLGAIELPYDFESFVFFAWPVVLPWYLWKTRRGRGVLYAVAVYALSVIPNVTAAVVRVASRL